MHSSAKLFALMLLMNLVVYEKKLKIMNDIGVIHEPIGSPRKK